MKTGAPSGIVSISQRAWRGVRAQAAEARRLADAREVLGRVDGEPVAARPAGRQVRLVPGERQHAAAVGRARVGHAQLVGDGEAPLRRRVRRPADRHRERAHGVALAAHEQLALREVGVQRPGRAVEPRVAARSQPTAPFGSSGACTASQSPSRRTTPKTRGDFHSVRAATRSSGLPGRAATQQGCAAHVGGRVAGDLLRLGRERRRGRSALLGHEVARAVVAESRPSRPGRRRRAR